MRYQPMPLGRRADPFDDPEWLFELKYDDFRALAFVEFGRCTLYSRNGYQFASFQDIPLQILPLPESRSNVRLCPFEASTRRTGACRAYPSRRSHYLFERERRSEPVPGWPSCELACDEVEASRLRDRSCVTVCHTVHELLSKGQKRIWLSLGRVNYPKLLANVHLDSFLNKKDIGNRC